MLMRRGRPKVSTTYCESVPTTSIFLVDGFAFGFDAEIDGHAEEVEVLVDVADGAEALVIAEAIDGVLVGEGGRAGAVDPLGEEGRELLLALGFGHFFKVGGADGLVGVLAERALERGQEGFVADFAAQHVEDHGALFEGHGLELGREGIEAADAGERDGVVGERAGGDVLQRAAQGAVAAFFFDVHQLAVAGHAVGDPGVVEGAGADLGTPPLMGDGVGEEADAGLVADARAHDGGEFGSPDGGQGVVGEFDDVEVRGFRGAEAVGKEVVLFGGGLGELRCRWPDG